MAARWARSLAALLTVALLGVVAPVISSIVEAPPAAAVAPTPPFTQCPLAGQAASCAFLVYITDSGQSILRDPNIGPYDGQDDMSVGVVNASSSPVTSIAIVGLGTGEPAFGFDGDGICTYLSARPECQGALFNNYAPQGIGFSDFSPDLRSGRVNFTSGLAANSATYFSLEGSPVSTTLAPNGYARTVGETLGSLESSTDVTDPVSTTYGNFHDQWLDLPANSGLAGLNAYRSYNALDTNNGVMGPGWRTPFSDSISATGGIVTLVREDGRNVKFVPASGGGWQQPLEFPGVLSQNPDTTYKLTFPEGETWSFDTAGRLTQRSWWDGQSVGIARDGSGRVSTVTSANGPSLAFVYGTSGASAGRLVSITASDGRVVQYGYTGLNQLLTSVTDPSNATTTMTYDSGNRVASITDPTGVVSVSTTYDPASGSVTSQTTPDGTTTYAYNLAAGTTTVTNSTLNQSIVFTHDSFGRAIKFDAGSGQILNKTYGAQGWPANNVNQAGETTVLARNAAGLPLSMQTPENGTTSLTYDGSNRVTTMTSPVSGAATLAYTGSSRVPTSITDALNKTSTQTVNASGLVTSTTDADGVKLTYGYNARRQVTTVTDNANRVTTFAYDAAGRLTSVTTPENRVTATTYDAVGRVLTMTAPDGGVTTYTYDAAGRPKTTTDPTSKVTTASYSPTSGRLTSVQKPGQQPTALAYDAAGRLTQTTDPSNVTTKTTYDALGRTATTVDGANRTTTYGYDSVGRITSVIAPDGGATSRQFNAKGQVSQITDPAGRVSTMSYNANGLPSSVTTPQQGATTFAYDALGRMLSQTDATGVVTARTYTAAGRIASETSQGVTTTYAYDNTGRRTSATDPAGTTGFLYTPDGLLQRSTSPLGRPTNYAYNTAGRVSTVTDPFGAVTTLTWSLRGELLTSALTGRGTVTRAYNPDGTLASTVNALNETTTYSYDGAERLTGRTTSLGTETWGYTNGEVTSYTPVPIAGQPAGTETYSRDIAGRVNNMVDGAGRTHATTYNLAGDVTSRVDTLGASSITRSYDFDAAGREWRVTTPDGITTRSFDNAGRLTAETAPGSRITAWGYDSFGRVNTTLAPNGTSLRYNYDAAGRLATVTGPQSTTITDAFTAPDNSQPDPAKWTVTRTGSTTTTVQTNALNIGTDISGGTGRLRSSIGTPRDVDTSVGVAFVSTSPLFRATVSLGTRTQANGDGYRLELNSDAWNAQIIRRSGGTDTVLGSVTVPLGNPIALRFAVDGTAVRAKAWAYGAAEPNTWGYTGTDTSITTGGNVDYRYASNTANTNRIDDFSATTNPSSATYLTRSYNSDSQLASETLPGGNRAYTYNAASGKLAQVAQTLPGANRTTDLTYDTSGAVRTTATGGITSTYTYDAASQLTGIATSSGPGNQSFTYNRGRVATATVDGVTTTNTYDARSRLLTASPAGGTPTSFTYNPAGDRLTETTGTNTLTYNYDSVGRIANTQRATSGTVNKTTTRRYSARELVDQYTVTGTGGTPLGSYGIDWDVNRAVPQPLSWTDSTTPALTQAHVSTERGPVATLTNNVGTAVAADVFGSTLPSTGQSANYGTGYDAWGRAASPSASNAQRLGFRNELTIDGLTYLRNRNYDTTSRQFTQTDPVPPEPGAPTEPTHYDYTQNDPLNRIDPLGLSSHDDPPITQGWDANANNQIGSADFFVGFASQAFRNVKGLVSLVGNVGQCAASGVSAVLDFASLPNPIPGGWSCDNLRETISGARDLAVQMWHSISDLLLQHDSKALFTYYIRGGALLTGVNMGDCLKKPQGSGADQHFNTYAYCVGAFIGGGLTNYLTAEAGASALKAAFARVEDAVQGAVDATNSARGLSDFGGVIEQTGTNAAGGRIFTSTGGISQNDFAGIVNSGLMRGDEVTILTGAHGAVDGSLVADSSMLAADVARFGSMPGVRVLDVSAMSAAEIRAAMESPGTIIGGFCNSEACLAPRGG